MFQDTLPNLVGRADVDAELDVLDSRDGAPADRAHRENAEYRD